MATENSQRDRIAAVIEQNLAAQLPSDLPDRYYEWIGYDTLADAVIAALGLREEFGALDDYDGGLLADTREELLPLHAKETIKRRFITDWENDEVQ